MNNRPYPHPVNAENNLSPHQMWLNGVLTHVNSSSVAVINMYGNPLAETIEERLRGYGLDPANFTENNDQPPADNVLVFTAEEKERLLSYIRDQPTPALKYQKCLEFFERFDDSD